MLTNVAANAAAQLDSASSVFREWAATHAWTEQPLLFVEWAFDKHTLLYWTVALAAVLLARRQVREAALSVAVMWSTLELSGWGKVLFARERPEWQNTVNFHESGSFPSSHAAGTAALMGLVLVFVVLRSRSELVRRWGSIAVGTTVLVVCLDRLMLGRHYPSDLAAGLLLGGGVVVAAVAVLAVLSGRATEVPVEVPVEAPVELPVRERQLVGRAA